MLARPFRRIFQPDDTIHSLWNPVPLLPNPQEFKLCGQEATIIKTLGFSWENPSRNEGFSWKNPECGYHWNFNKSCFFSGTRSWDCHESGEMGSSQWVKPGWFLNLRHFPMGNGHVWGCSLRIPSTSNKPGDMIATGWTHLQHLVTRHFPSTKVYQGTFDVYGVRFSC